MKQKLSRLIIFFATLVCILSSIALLINYFIYQYPGNNYFPENVSLYFLFLVLFNIGLILYYPNDNKIRQIGRELIYFFIIMSLIAYASNAVQLTPFPPIDLFIVNLEEQLNISMEGILIWIQNYPKFKYLLGVIYDSLPAQMSYLPLFVIIYGKFHLIREYYFYLLCTAVIGFGFYYFLPTTAPASVINSPLFLPEQIDTGLKFWQIHHYINPSTNNGGLIALPSFHTIWAILCVNFLREWKFASILLFVINILLIASCVLLGWHYLIDILGGIIVLYISSLILQLYIRTRP